MKQLEIGVRKRRRYVAIDETVIKCRKKRYYVAVDVKRMEIIAAKKK